MTQNGVTYLLTYRQTQPFIVKDVLSRISTAAESLTIKKQYLDQMSINCEYVKANGQQALK